MRIFVICKGCKEKLYLATSLTDRGHIYESYGDPIGLECSRCDHFAKYAVRNLTAEKDPSLWMLAVIFGAVIGIIAGPFGVLLGAAIGLLLQYGAEMRDKERVKNFNTKTRIVFV